MEPAAERAPGRQRPGPRGSQGSSQSDAEHQYRAPGRPMKSTRMSRTICRSSLRGFAPSAARTAISRRLDAPASANRTNALSTATATAANSKAQQDADHVLSAASWSCAGQTAACDHSTPRSRSGRGGTLRRLRTPGSSTAAIERPPMSIPATDESATSAPPNAPCRRALDAEAERARSVDVRRDVPFRRPQCPIGPAHPGTCRAGRSR